MPDVEWRQTARADLLAIIDYISDDNPDAAQRLKDDIETRVAGLPAQPRLYRTGRVPGTREMVVHPNYVVVYAELGKVIAILRVLHAAQQWPPAGLP
ncbi:type II toxin-antitoxin system RelE/ParE family toxin [Dyella sp. LX-66]|uniref:type II toxin-antitoxin system RelE/ParE family toxin n=1 Tax=unclassified Dyella TaxID=2634549 RepID=UPI0014474735|nr:type II toxin-antitoxin system RelE/ParE family toxin [Dyella sp. LX-1]MBT2140612.1 type II toxin-antitoxin system RelE/ParE family toxin [Dyella sp. LX-66]NKJ22682.1 addiction module RelE/StbE family toxin [Dyella sp. SG609]